MMVLQPRTDWDPSAWRSERFAPIQSVLARFEAERSWPTVERLNELLGPAMRAALGPQAPSFELQIPSPRRKRPRVSRSVDDLYDGCIQVRGCIPTRSANWHDFFNACVWAWLPRAKFAMSQRQYAAAKERLPDAFVALPATRSREQDALALLDEGGVLQCPGGPPLLFGHALYEHLVSSEEPVRAFVAQLPVVVHTDADLDVAVAEALQARSWPAVGNTPALWVGRAP